MRAPRFFWIFFLLGYNGNTIRPWAPRPLWRCFMCEEAVYDVVALGELLIDFTPCPPMGRAVPRSRPIPGRAGQSSGRPEQIWPAHRLSGQGGRGCLGHLLLESLRRAGVQTRGIRLTSSAFTTLAFVTLDAAGDRPSALHASRGRTPSSGGRRWTAPHPALPSLPLRLPQLTDEPARSATWAAVAYARELGRTVTLIPTCVSLWPSRGGPGPDPVEPVPGGCGQAQRRGGGLPLGLLPQEGARRLLEEVASPWPWSPWVPGAATSRTGGGSCALTAPQVSPVDTTGAGDIFGGSALHRLLDFRVPPEELDRGGLEEIARFAVTAASLSTQHPGGIPSIPELAQVVVRMGEPPPSPYESPLLFPLPSVL